MNKLYKHPARLLIGLLALVFAKPAYIHAQDDDIEEEIFELNPFTVEANEDSGYRATTTLAGSRIRSKISDLGSSIAVGTKEFLDDTGATDAESLLSYVGSTEVGGTQGNFSASTFDGQDRANSNNSRIAPEGAQRIRGLDAAVVTRNYFRTLTPFDGYNTSRVTINRGPNSVLFGLGSPGGVIDNSLNAAAIGSDMTEVSFRFDHRGGHRGTIDLNRTLLDDRLAVRFSAMKEDIKFKQEPAFEEDTRFYGAFNWTVFKNENTDWLDRTTLSGNFESGDINRNPPDVIPPHDAMYGWYTGYKDPLALLRVPGVDIEDLESASLTQDDVRAAVSAGIETVPDGMTLDEFAEANGQFVPKTHFNRFMGDRGPGWNTHPWIKAWFIYPSITFGSGNATQAGYEDPALAGISGLFGRWRPNGFATLDQLWSDDPVRRLPNFTATSIQDRNVFDYHNKLFQGTTNFVNTDFDSHQATLQQTLWNGKAGIDLSFDRQTKDRERRTPFSDRLYKSIHIDVTTHQPNGDTDLDGFGDSFVNENFGRPVVVEHNNVETHFRSDEQETTRATVFGTLNFKDIIGSDMLSSIFGEHTATGLFEKRTNDWATEVHRPIWNALNGPDPGANNISNGLNDNFRRYLRVTSYVGPSAAEATSADQVRITDTVNVPWPELGDQHRIIYFDNDNAVDGPGEADWFLVNHFNRGDVNQTELSSDAFSIQSRWFDNHIVSLFAWRTDEEEAFQRIQEDIERPDSSRPELIALRTPEGEFNRELLFLEPEPASVARQSTMTWSLVGHFPEEKLFELPFGLDLSAHYFEAESFEPAGISNNILNEPLASPFGTTKEHGFTVSMFDQKLSARFNWYKTVKANGRSDGVTGAVSTIATRARSFLTSVFEAEDNDMPIEDTGVLAAGITSYDQWYDTIINFYPPELRSVLNYRVVEHNVNGSIIHGYEDDVPQGVNGTFDVVAKGFELDIVGNVTDNLTISANLAQQETVQDNSGPVAFPFAFEMEQNIRDSGLWDIPTQPFRGSPATYGQNFTSNMATIRGLLAKDGTVSQELREWRANVVARYAFTDGKFKGASIGSALRYQDKIAVGYPLLLDEAGGQIPDIANPFFGPDEINGDMWVTYSRPIADGKVDWSIQLNARNLYRSNGDDDVPVTINPDGTTATIRIPNERLFFLTNTFRF